jgi:outer membrane protein assembly factor BamB
MVSMRIARPFKGGKITGSPIVAGETMYVVSHDGTLYAVIRSE